MNPLDMHGLWSVADVKFLDKETGEEVFVSEMQMVKVEREPIIGETSIGLNLGHQMNKSVKIGLSKAKIDGILKAKLLGLHKDKKISKLMHLHERTKRKRIKKKLNKRILNEVNNILKQEYREVNKV